MLFSSVIRLILGSTLLVSALPGRPIPDFDLASELSDHSNQYPFEFGQQKEGQIQIDEPSHLDGHHSSQPVPAADRTIYQILRDDENFSRLVKAIDTSDDIVSLLSDPTAAITFFAVPNSALRRPHKGPHKHPHHKHPHRKHPHHDEAGIDQMHTEENAFPEVSGKFGLVEIISLIEELEVSSLDEDKRKKWLQRRLHAILAYHILPAPFGVGALSDNTTFATSLTLSGHGQPLRIRVYHSLYPPITKINFFTRIVGHNVEALNGIIHIVNHPLLPPPSIFQELFNVPSIFSTLTSALQRAGLTDHLDLRYAPGKDGEKGSWEGTRAATIFAPTNHAFAKLPKKLQHYLFSPFGTRILKKLLEFHIIPDVVVHSDYIYNKSSDTASSYGDAQMGTSEILEIEECSETTDKITPDMLRATSCDTSSDKYSSESHQWLDDAGSAEDCGYDDVDMGTDEYLSVDRGQERRSRRLHLAHMARPSYHSPPPSGSCQRLCPCHLIQHPPPFPPQGEFDGPNRHSRLPPLWGPASPFSSRKESCNDIYSDPLERGCGDPRLLPRHTSSSYSSCQHSEMYSNSPFTEDSTKSDDHFNCPLRHHTYSVPFPFRTPCHGSDLCRRGSPGEDYEPTFKGRCHSGSVRPPGHPIYSVNLTLPTLLTNHSLHAHIEKFKITLRFPGPNKPHKTIIKFFVNRRPVHYPDVVARNGAVHVINKLLIPHHPKHKNDDTGEYRGEDMMDGWEDWEEWLPQWASED